MYDIISKIRKQSSPVEETDFLPTALGNHHDDVLKGRMPVVLFGAGSFGIRLSQALKIHHVNITCFCDNDTGFIGDYCAGHPVISVDDLRQNHRDSLIIITTSSLYMQQAFDQLISLGFSSDTIHILPLDHMIYYTNVVKLYWPAADLHTYAQELRDAYNLLSDQKSKDLFIHRIALFAGGFDYQSFRRFIDDFAEFRFNHDPHLFTRPLFDENYFYFHSEFFPLMDQEVFANVGALLGECAIEFANACREKGFSYKEIINFEPDPNNFVQLSANMAQLPHVRCLPYGLWSQESRLRFYNPDQAHAGTPGRLDESGEIEVEVRGLDELLPDAEITLMKMDVEGAEMEALRGAAETIRHNRPKLAISVYHKRNDIFESLLFLHQIHAGYRFYLRHHSTTFSETVLFAVP